MKREPGLDFLRAIAIIWVLFFHGMTEGLGSPCPEIAWLGWMGVDLFFVLSGYLIGSQLLKSYAQGDVPSLAAFYRRRAFRILPAYWVVLAFYFLVPGFREAPGIQPAWQFLTFTENLLIDSQHNRAFSHAWSLCVEEHFYLIFPLLAWALLRRPSWKLTALACAGILGGGIILRAYVWLHYFKPAMDEHPGKFVELIYYPTYMRLDGLLAGVIVASLRCFRPTLWQKAMDNAYPILVVGAVSLAGSIWLVQGRTDFNASVFGFPLLSISLALIVAAFVSPKCFFGRCRIPGAKAIATVTFSLYLSHKMTWHVVRSYFPQLVSPGGPQAFCVYAGSALLIGSLLYLLVERPFLLWRNRIDLRSSLAIPPTTQTVRP